MRRELEPCIGVCEATVEGPDVLLPEKATQALAMVLHELVTNSAKYGALSTPRGRVCVHWGCRSNGSSQSVLTIRWQEIGGPPVRAPTRRGYGTSVICELIPYELGGAVDINYVTDGVQCRIEFPLEKVAGHDLPTASRTTRCRLTEGPKQRLRTDFSGCIKHALEASASLGAYRLGSPNSRNAASSTAHRCSSSAYHANQIAGRRR